MAHRIELRPDARIEDHQQLLVRMNDDRDVVAAMKLALAGAEAYRVLPSFAETGAIAVSCFLVADHIEAEIVVRGTRWSVYGIAPVGRLQSLGVDLVATNVYDGDDLLPLSDRHVDVIVGPYPAGLAPYAQLPKPQQRQLREDLRERFTLVLRAFDPRRTLDEGWEVR